MDISSNSQAEIYKLRQDITRLQNEFDTLQRSVSLVKPTTDEINKEIKKDLKHEVALRNKNRELELAQLKGEIADAKGRFLERPTLVSILILVGIAAILVLLWTPMLPDALSSRPDPSSVQNAYEEISKLQIRILKLQEKDNGDKLRDEKIKELQVKVENLKAATPRVTVSVKNDN